MARPTSDRKQTGLRAHRQSRPMAKRQGQYRSKLIAVCRVQKSTRWTTSARPSTVSEGTRGLTRVAVYEQSVDDFTFTKKPKKAATQQSPPVAEEKDNNLRSNQSGPEPRSRKAKPDEVATNANEPRRRSKRLSGEKSVGEANEQRAQPRNEEQTDAEAISNAPDNQRGRARQLHRTPNNEGRLHVDKKRRATKIALPFADTPVIQRNREMRQTSSENRRRSSSTMRGRRASSLIDSGTSNGMGNQEKLVVERG